MAKVKISAIGLLDMLYFKGKKNKREKRIPRPRRSRWSRSTLPTSRRPSATPKARPS